MRRRKFFELLLSMPKTIYVNLKLFGFAGFKLPLLISHRTIINELHRGSVVIKCRLKFGLLVFGFSDGSFGKRYGQPSFLSVQNGGRLVLNGSANIAQSSSIAIFKDARLELGNRFSANYDFLVSCKNRIQIGDDALFGWNVSLLDNDGHDIIQNDGTVSNKPAPIFIGNHVWVCSNSTCLKGARLPDGCILASQSLLAKEILCKNALVAGSPARLIKQEVNWRS